MDFFARKVAFRTGGFRTDARSGVPVQSSGKGGVTASTKRMFKNERPSPLLLLRNGEFRRMCREAGGNARNLQNGLSTWKHGVQRNDRLTTVNYGGGQGDLVRRIRSDADRHGGTQT